MTRHIPEYVKQWIKDCEEAFSHKAAPEPTHALQMKLLWSLRYSLIALEAIAKCSPEFDGGEICEILEKIGIDIEV